MNVTLRDVAEKSGLSITTVSRALNGYDDVAPATKQTIQDVANSLGYSPNLNARRLKMQKAETIGLILPHENLRFSDPFFSDLLSGIVERCAFHKLELSVTTPISAETTQTHYRRLINSSRVDGFILVRVALKDPRIDLLKSRNIPFVAFGRSETAGSIPYVDEDGALGTRTATQHLIDLGHTRIAHIAEPTTLSKAHNRLLGYKTALSENGIGFDPDLVAESNYRQRSGRLAAEQLFALDTPPTAIVAGNDLLALGAMSYIQEIGLTIGKDVSIIGFDDILLSEYANPPLTTLHQPAHEMGILLTDTLVSQIKKDGNFTQTLLPPSLVIRQSTGAANSA